MASLAEYLSSELTKDLKWREEEMAVMRKQLYLSTQGGMQERVLLRASLAMIYAHYEGYCKFAIEIYLDALHKLKLPRKDFVWKLASYSLREFHEELQQASSANEFFTDFLFKFNEKLDEEATFNDVPKTSNLWPEILIRWLDELDLQSDCVKDEETRLESLVRNRNQIAHGKKLVVKDRVELDKYANAALIAMHEVAVGVVGALELKSYKASGSASTLLNHAV